jgi:tetratricopeptide (TPR) repeat protein
MHDQASFHNLKPGYLIVGKIRNWNTRSPSITFFMSSIHNSEAQFHDAFQTARSGRRDEAEQKLRELLVKHPNHPDILHLLGVLLLESERGLESAHLLKEAVDQRPDNAQFHYHHGLALVGVGDTDGAVSAFGKAVALDDGSYEARYNLAKALKDQGCFDGAAAAYQELLDRAPSFTEALYNLANLRYEMDQTEEAEALFKKLLSENPGHLNARTNLAMIKSRHGQTERAIEILENVMAIDPNHKDAKGLLRRLYNNKIPAWHFDMLNDEERNKAYHQAISAAADKAEYVLEIGTGSGLLAMMAARAGARKVTTCEMSKPLAAIAHKVIARNGYADIIRVIPEKSTRLKIGVELPEPADLLIAEVFDNGLLGEHFLPALLHAKRNLLKEDAIIIPAAATIYTMLIECPQLRRVNPIKNIAGFDLSDFDRFRSPGYRQICLENISYQALSDPVAVCHLDFQNDVPTSAQDNLEVRIRRTGVCQAAAFWFDLHLDKKNKISTLHGAHSNHWKQALQFFSVDLQCTAGDTVKLGVTQNLTGFEFILENGRCRSLS